MMTVSIHTILLVDPILYTWLVYVVQVLQVWISRSRGS
jgi:hypothetical protein